jgi:hypothetical protein
MSTYGDGWRDLAADLIGVFGDDLTVTLRDYPSAHNNITGSSDRGEPLEYPGIPGAIESIELESFEGQQHGDVQLDVPGAGVLATIDAPNVGDWTCEFSNEPGAEYPVVMPVRTCNPDGGTSAASWAIIVRKGAASGN